MIALADGGASSTPSEDARGALRSVPTPAADSRMTLMPRSRRVTTPTSPDPRGRLSTGRTCHTVARMSIPIPTTPLPNASRTHSL